MPRATRTRQPTRRPRTGKKQVLVFVDALVTERRYLEDLHKSSGSPLALRIDSKAKNPGEVVQRAKAEYDDGYRGRIWCAFDQDDYGQHFLDAVSRAEKLGFEQAFSVPNFEYFLLLHFMNCRAELSQGEAEDRLDAIFRKKLGKPYDKGNLCIDDFLPGLDTAVERAKEIEALHRSQFEKPWTGMGRLVDLIRGR